MSALGDRGITLEGLAAAVDALRQELATWKALARKQDALTADQITATQSGATAAKISQIAVNTAAIQSLAAQVAGQISLAYVTTLPATGEPLTLYLVPQGDGTAPNFCNEYLWINDAWELIGTTGAMANNGELAIQVNGVTVGTFTANQAANSAVNITVPTNTNQLVNGAGYVDTAALQAALLLKQNSLTAVQLAAVDSGITAAAVQQIADNATAIAGKQDALTVAQQAAVDSGATAAKIDQIAANASAIVSLTSSKQDQLSTTQLAAVNSGVTAAAVQQIGTNASNISSLATAVSGKAADDQVVHLAGAETITGDKTLTGAVVTHHITPETDNAYSLGSASYQWASVYAQTYYYKGTAWGLDQNNIWTGENTFSSTLKQVNGTVTKGTIPQSDTTAFSMYWGGTGVSSLNNALFAQRGYINADGSTLYSLYAQENATGGTNTQLGLRYDPNDTVNKRYAYLRGDFRPYSDNAFNLGTSGNKWKTLNGINPGALSFPANSYVAIDTTDFNKSGGRNTYTPPSDGWIGIQVSSVSYNANYYVFIGRYTDGSNANPSYWSQGQVSPLMANFEGYMGQVFIPVIGGKVYHIRVNGDFSSGGYIRAYFFPCLGNV